LTNHENISTFKPKVKKDAQDEKVFSDTVGIIVSLLLQFLQRMAG
jgi:hypothetical protein